MTRCVRPLGRVCSSRWARNCSARRRRSATACSGSTAPYSPRWVGTIRLTKIHRMAGTCYLFEHGSFLTETGWVLLPGGAPEPPGTGMPYRHLEGHWYRFSWDPF